MREVTHDERRAEEIRIFLTNRGLGNQQATIWAEELSRTIRATYDAAGFVRVENIKLHLVSGMLRDLMKRPSVAEEYKNELRVIVSVVGGMLAATGGDDAGGCEAGVGGNVSSAE